MPDLTYADDPNATPELTAAVLGAVLVHTQQREGKIQAAKLGENMRRLRFRLENELEKVSRNPQLKRGREAEIRALRIGQKKFLEEVEYYLHVLKKTYDDLDHANWPKNMFKD